MVLSTNLINRLNTDETNISNLQGKTSALTYDSGTDTLSISSKVNIAKDLSDVGSIYLGDNAGNDVIYVRGNISQTITPTQLGYISGLTSSC